MISLQQKNTLTEYMILSGADNRPPMLDKDLYDSWKSRMELYMQNREHERMILELIKHDSLIWPTIEENRVIRTKKYAELSASEKIQADCDMKATNIMEFVRLLKLFIARVQTSGSGISSLLAVGITFTGSGNLYYQWELSPGSENALCILFPTILP
nr:hypothetical protein [Tanacetum cinerariifolium]